MVIEKVKSVMKYMLQNTKLIISEKLMSELIGPQFFYFSVY